MPAPVPHSATPDPVGENGVAPGPSGQPAGGVRIRPGRLAGAGLAVVLLVLGPLALAQLNRAGIGRNLVYAEYNERAIQSGQRTNQLRGQLRLSTGTYLPNGLIEGRGMVIEQYTPEGRTNLVARAPECIVNPVTRIAQSTGTLDLIAMEGRFALRGLDGFEAGITNTTLTLSNRVRMVINQPLLRTAPLPAATRPPAKP